jgi:hypothetical protein
MRSKVPPHSGSPERMTTMGTGTVQGELRCVGQYLWPTNCIPLGFVARTVARMAPSRLKLSLKRREAPMDHHRCCGPGRFNSSPDRTVARQTILISEDGQRDQSEEAFPGAAVASTRMEG